MLEGVKAAVGIPGHSVKVYADFVYLGLKEPLNLNSCVCWLKRQSFGREDLKLCLHADEATAVDGLSTTMLPKNKYENCWHFSPPPSHPQDVEVAADPPLCPVVDAAENPPAVPVSELWEPTPAEYEGLYPTVCLTPSLVQPLSPLAPNLAHMSAASLPLEWRCSSGVRLALVAAERWAFTCLKATASDGKPRSSSFAQICRHTSA